MTEELSQHEQIVQAYNQYLIEHQPLKKKV